MAASLILSTLMFSGTAEDIVSRMTLEEKVGQLFVVPASPDRGDDHLADLHTLIERYHIGGILLKQGDQASYRTLYEKLNAPTLLHVGDAEWGVSMRMSDGVKYPRNLTLGAIQDLSLLRKFGQQLGKECEQVGIHLNLAPVADVNTNPLNPVIGTRSFGDNPTAVAERVNIVVQALQEKVAATVKHYPGHGDTTVDSHRDLPVITELQLEPFQKAIAHGVQAVLTAHLFYQDEVVTFSHALVEEKLRNEMGFEGLIITDALNMGALDKYTDIALKALLAGHDILLYGAHKPEHVDQILRTDVPAAIQSILASNPDQKLLDKHVIRIIRAKQKLIHPLPASTPLASPEAVALQKTLYQNAVTVISNEHIPLKGGVQLTQFGAPSETLSTLLPQSPDGLKVVAIYEMTDAAKAYLALEKPDILLLFTSPYKLLEITPAPTTILGYEREAEEAVVDILLGKRTATGKLPVKL